MKRNVYLSLLCFSILSLSACSNKDGVPDEIYNEIVDEEDSINYDEIVSNLVDAFNARYTLNDSDVKEIESLFIDSTDFNNSYNNWKSFVNDNLSNVSQSNLYIDSLIKDVENYYYEAKDFGLKHGVLYTNGKKTGLEVSMEEITPLIEGQNILSESDSDLSNGNGELMNHNEIVDNIDNTIEEETTEYVLSDEEYKAYMDELFATEPDYIEYTLEGLENDLSLLETKNDIATYCIDHYHDFNGGDWGDYDPTFDDLLLSYVCYRGYDDEGSTIIEKETWDNFSIEEAREHVKNVLVYNYDSCNAYLLEEYELMNTDEYKQMFIDSRRTAKEDFERLKEQYGIVEETESLQSDISEYELWCKSNEDYINYIDNHDFENPVFSEVIETDENGRYIPWSKIFELADSDGRISDYLEFVAYGDIVKIEMPEAPRSYYSDKLMKVHSNEIVINHTGVKSIELELNMPDKEGLQSLVINLTDDNKLVYNSNISSIIFN